jgi:hypothetical protein
MMCFFCLNQVNKFKSAAKATVLKPAGTFTRVTLVREVSSGLNQPDADNSDDEQAGDGTGGEDDNGGYKSNVNSGQDSP